MINNLITELRKKAPFDCVIEDLQAINLIKFYINDSICSCASDDSGFLQLCESEMKHHKTDVNL